MEMGGYKVERMSGARYETTHTLVREARRNALELLQCRGDRTHVDSDALLA